MTDDDSRTPSLANRVRAQASETLHVVGAHDMPMSPRPDWPHEEFLAWLDGLRSQLGLENDHQLAAYLGMHHSRISNWRSGQYKPSIPTLNKIAAVIGEDPRRLWVLVGQANAIDVGLLNNDTAPRIDLNLPAELVEAIAAFRRPELTEDDQVRFRWGLRTYVRGFIAELVSRQPNNHPKSGKRAG